MVPGRRPANPPPPARPHTHLAYPQPSLSRGTRMLAASKRAALYGLASHRCIVLWIDCKCRIASHHIDSVAHAMLHYITSHPCPDRARARRLYHSTRMGVRGSVSSVAGQRCFCFASMMHCLLLRPANNSPPPPPSGPPRSRLPPPPLSRHRAPVRVRVRVRVVCVCARCVCVCACVFARAIMIACKT